MIGSPTIEGTFMTNSDIYLLRALEARADADAATLENVRESCLRSEAVWKAMAAEAARMEKLRAKRIAESLVATTPEKFNPDETRSLRYFND